MTDTTHAEPLAIAPAEELLIGGPGPGAPPLEEPRPLPPLGATPTPFPVMLGKAGEDALRHILRMEGELVHALRCPDGPEDAWRWTDAEIRALMPLMRAGAERYGVAGALTEHGPMVAAAGALFAHVSRSLIAERQWRRTLEHETTPWVGSDDTFDPKEPLHVPDRPDGRLDPAEPATGPDGAVSDDQPRTGLGRARVDHLSSLLGSQLRP